MAERQGVRQAFSAALTFQRWLRPRIDFARGERIEFHIRALLTLRHPEGVDCNTTGDCDEPRGPARHGGKQECALDGTDEGSLHNIFGIRAILSHVERQLDKSCSLGNVKVANERQTFVGVRNARQLMCFGSIHVCLRDRAPLQTSTGSIGLRTRVLREVEPLAVLSQNSAERLRRDSRRLRAFGCASKLRAPGISERSLKLR
jgi:hypothetical protein